jgi:hypothetical protein
MSRALLLAVWIAAPPAWALVDHQGQKAGLSVQGSGRTFSLVDEATDTAAGVNRLRLDASLWVGDLLQVEAAGEYTLTLGPLGALATAPPTQLRWDDFDASSEGQNYATRPDLDRLNLVVTTTLFELRVGRQGIGHGSARAFPVTDLFAPFAGFSLDTEFKRGVDAGRLTVPLGDMSEVEAYAVAHRAGADEGLYLLRFRTAALGPDLSLLAGQTYGETTVGLDVQANAGGAGLYLDGLVRPSVGADSLRATVGATYRFLAGVTLTVEAHHDRGGAADPEDLPAALQRPAFQSGETVLTGRWYGALLLDWEMTALLHPSFAVFQNFSDDSSMLLPGLRWDAGQETTVTLGGLFGRGHGELSGADSIYADVRLYF